MATLERTQLLNLLRENQGTDALKKALNKLDNDQKKDAEKLLNTLETTDPTIQSQLDAAKNYFQEQKQEKSKSEINAPATNIHEQIEKKYFDPRLYKIESDNGNIVVSRTDSEGKARPFFNITNDTRNNSCTIMSQGKCSQEEYEGMLQVILDSRTLENKNKPVFLFHENKDELDKMIAAAKKANVPYAATMKKEEFESAAWRKQFINKEQEGGYIAKAKEQEEESKQLHITPNPSQ